VCFIGWTPAHRGWGRVVSLVSRSACRSGLVTWRQRFARRSQFTLAWLVPQAANSRTTPTATLYPGSRCAAAASINTLV